MGQESYKTVHTALEAIGSGDELDIAAFRSDDFLGKVLDKFGWLLKYQPPNTKNKDNTLFGKAAWNELLKTATKKQMDQSLKPSDLDLLETFSYLEGDEKKLELATLSEAMAAAVQGTAKKKAKRSTTQSSSFSTKAKAKGAGASKDEDDDVMALFS